MQTGDDFRIFITQIVDDRFLQAAKTGGGINRHVFDACGFEHIRHEIRTWISNKGFAWQLGGGFFSDGFCADFNGLCHRRGGGYHYTRGGGRTLQK